MEQKLSLKGTKSLGDLLVQENTNKILEDSAEYFTHKTNADIFEVNDGFGTISHDLGDEEFLGAIKTDENRASKEPRLRIIFLDGIPGSPGKLPITASLLRRTMTAYNITPRVAGFLTRQAMPGRVIHHDENTMKMLRQELWYSCVIRSTIKSDTERDHPSRRVIDWMMTLIWSDYNVNTRDMTLMVWRCPATVKESFLSTFLGANGGSLLLYPMLVHAFFAEEILRLTYDFIGVFSESIYEWEFKGQNTQSAEDYTERSQAFLALSRQIRQVATDYDILEESISVLQKAYIWFKEELNPDTKYISTSPNSDNVLLDVFNRFPKEVSLIRTYSGLYLQRTKIGVNECFALTTQLDAKLNLSMASESTQMARASHQDNRALRIIQILSIIFLPASLVASIFGMGFFNTSPGDPSGSIFTISENWWYYPAVSVPLTIAIMMIVFGFAAWERRAAKERKKPKDVESGNSEKVD